MRAPRPPLVHTTALRASAYIHDFADRLLFRRVMPCASCFWRRERHCSWKPQLRARARARASPRSASARDAGRVMDWPARGHQPASTSDEIGPLRPSRLFGLKHIVGCLAGRAVHMTAALLLALFLFSRAQLHGDFLCARYLKNKMMVFPRLADNGPARNPEWPSAHASYPPAGFLHGELKSKLGVA